MVKVLIADDHAQVRAGVRALLADSEGICTVGAACDGQEAWELAAELQPDVVVIDLAMPILDGVEATRRIVRTCPRTRVLVLTAFRDRERIARALAAGATGCLFKDDAPEAIVAAVRSAAEETA
ncbi:MAG TPA: response regulator transcription factor [Gaiellaceae bacterium]|nr:response regulator transcription factor [Gaiellaceae bacterium]